MHNFIYDGKYETGTSIINELTNLLAISRNKKQKDIIDMICNLYLKLSSDENSTTSKSDLDNFVKSEMATNKKYIVQPSMLAVKAKHAINVERNIHKFLEITTTLSKSNNSEHWAEFIVSAFSDVGQDYNKAENYLTSIKDSISKQFYNDLMYSISIDNSKYDLALNFLDEAYNNGMSTDDYYIKKSFALLKAARFQEVISLVNINLQSIKSKSSIDTLIINRECSNKKLNKRIDDLAVRNIVSRALSKSLVLCAECLLDQEVKIKITLQKISENDYLKLHIFSSWPVIPREYIDDLLISRVSSISKTDAA